MIDAHVSAALEVFLVKNQFVKRNFKKKISLKIKMISNLRKAILLLFPLVCLTEGSKLMQKLDGVCTQNKILNCTNDITKCGPHGECVAIEQKTGNQTEMNCQCDNEYITVKSACDYYVQKSQLAAFLLSLFLACLEQIGSI